MTNKYKLRIDGKDVKRFIKNLISKKIELYDILIKDGYAYITVEEDGYQEIKKIKTSYKIKVVEEYGPIKLQHFGRKYFVFFMFLILGIILLEVLSNIIFSIEVKHAKSDIRQLVLNDLKEYGIEKYRFKVSFKEKEKIISKILSKEVDRLEWLEIETIGTKYVVKVEERVKKEKEKEKKEQHIVAKKNAMILEIQADSGEVVTKKNDYVKKGDILISGFISKDEEIKKKVHAEGIVFGEVWYNVSISLPKTYKEVKIKEEKKKTLEINFLNHNLFLFNFKPFKTYKIKRVKLLENKLLPIDISYSELQKTEEIVKRYDTSKGEKEGIKMAEEKLKRKLSSKDSIISKKVLKKREKNSTIEMDIFFKVKEDITDYESIEDINIEELEGEKDGASQ